jgi:hypothetical protein
VASLIARVITARHICETARGGPKPRSDMPRSFLPSQLANQRWKLGERLIRGSAALLARCIDVLIDLTGEEDHHFLFAKTLAIRSQAHEISALRTAELSQRRCRNIGFARVLHFGPVILQVCEQVRFVGGRIGIGIDVFFSGRPPAEQPARAMRSVAKRQTDNTIGVPILSAIARPVIWATPSAPLRRGSFLGQALL